jgi:hypothetical protein
MTTAAMITTCGRQQYLTRSMESLAANLPDVEHRFLVDDSGDGEYGRWLRATYPEWTVLSHPERAGLAAAVETGWDAIRRTDAEWIFHTEDDFTYLRPVPLEDMRYHFTSTAMLAQVVLYRQPWSPQEQAVGGYLADPRWKPRLSTAGRLWTGTHLFSFNPTLYPRWVVDRCVGGLEADVTAQLPGMRFGVLTAPDGGPMVWHFGAERSAGWSR